ncbi:alpha/beta hydrolase [Pseudoroseicyclus aestuarii]|uniref:Acetyl esterase n=1 Tax=Pseudoroseicyclus aestuarii TaxID=1795041 RepID=A0A318SZB0_9RHOB|nr:alpha/beta hydrolase [Pseudoroseicyclus aestuarii]PYE81354.1 acetyl esterase [Pseudoroseicyclus aestuarii]
MTITDPEVLRFIEMTEAAYPPEANGADAAENRRLYDAMCALFRAPRPEGLAVRDETAAGVPIRRYSPEGHAAGPFVLYAHGGGFVVGSLDSHDDVCAELAVATDCEVVSVDYRLAPEHLFPAQIEDVAAVWLAETAQGRPGIVMGDSAGGTLSAALCLRMRRLEGPMPLAQVLIYPGLGGDTDAPSYTQNAEAPLLRARDVTGYAATITGGDLALKRSEPEASPLRAGSFAGLPPALIVTADVDPLRDDGTAYHAALTEAGIRAQLRNEPQLVHGYLRARHGSARAAASFAAICDWTRAEALGQAPGQGR